MYILPYLKTTKFGPYTFLFHNFFLTSSIWSGFCEICQNFANFGFSAKTKRKCFAEKHPPTYLGKVKKNQNCHQGTFLHGSQSGKGLRDKHIQIIDWKF